MVTDRQTDVNHYRQCLRMEFARQTLILTTDLLDIRPKGTVVSYRGVYPYTLVTQLRHLQNWGGEEILGLFGTLGEEQK